MFYGDEHFPYGIERSGEFTREQAKLLVQHGCAYQALAEGSRAPVTREEELFIAVCRGERPAQSVHEKAWQLFCAKTFASKSIVSSPLVVTSSLVESSSETYLDDNFES